MKICAACSQELPKEKFSKKQWQLKCQRRCKECIADGREVATMEVSLSFAGGEGASDEDLFKDHQPTEECPICFLPRPLKYAESQYQSCCGKMICIGCVHAAGAVGDIRFLCPFCRAPAAASDGEYIERLKKRVDGDDASAIRLLGCDYRDGEMGLRRNMRKAMKLWLRAGELGDARGNCNAGHAYYNGRGVEVDVKKAKYYYELAAMGGDAVARHNLGAIEERAGNMGRAVKHWMISAGAGWDESLKAIRQCFLNGHATKNDFEKALRTHQESSDQMKSDQREAAPA